MALTLTMRLANLAHFLTAASKVPAEHVTYDPTASGMTATDVQAAIDELEAGGGGGGSQFTEEPTDNIYRFPTGFNKIGAEGGDNATTDAYIAIPDTFDLVGLDAYTATRSSTVQAAVGFVNVEGGRFAVAVNESTSTSKHKLTGGHGLVVPLLAADPSGGNSEAGQIYFNTTSGTFRGYDGSAWGELPLI